MPELETLSRPGSAPPQTSEPTPQASEPTCASESWLPSRGSGWPVTALSIAKLCAVGFSVVLCAQTLSLKGTARADFLLRNDLGAPLRRRLLLSLVIAVLVPALAGLAVDRRERRRRAQASEDPQTRARGSRASLEPFATIVAPLALAFALPVLFIWQFGQDKPVYYLILLSLFVFMARALLERSFVSLEEASFAPRLRAWGARARLSFAMRTPSWWALAVVVVASAAYAAYTGHFTILRHRLFQTTAFDLGIYDNLLYNTLHGHFFHAPVMFGPGNRNYIASHAEYAMVLFVPIYALHPNAETLLWVQAILFGAAAIPLFLFARTFLSQAVALVVSLLYLLFAPLHGPNFYDFHWLPISIFFQFWLYYAIAKRNVGLAVAMILVLFAIREDIAVGLTLLGVFLFLTGAWVRFGLVLSAVAASWFAFNKFVIMPWAGAWWFENLYNELFADGNSGYGSVITTLITNPIFSLTSFIRENKLAYGLHMIAPLAFLPLRKVAFLLLLIPGCIFTLMTTAYWPTVAISFQYTAHWIPYLFLATVLGLWLFRFEANGQARFGAAMIVLVIACLSHSYNFGCILQRESFVGGFSQVAFKMTDADRARYQALRDVLKPIPKEASVATTEYLTPHISARKEAYVISRTDVGPVDYILVSSRDLSSNLRKTLADKVRNEKYGLVVSTGGEFYLFKRGLDSASTSSALRTLGI